MNQTSDMLLIQSLAFLEKKVTIFRKNFKVGNYSYRIKNKTRQNKELKYLRKNIVWPLPDKIPACNGPGNHNMLTSYNKIGQPK